MRILRRAVAMRDWNVSGVGDGCTLCYCPFCYWIWLPQHCRPQRPRMGVPTSPRDGCPDHPGRWLSSTTLLSQRCSEDGCPQRSGTLCYCPFCYWIWLPQHCRPQRPRMGVPTSPRDGCPDHPGRWLSSTTLLSQLALKMAVSSALKMVAPYAAVLPRRRWLSLTPSAPSEMAVPYALTLLCFGAGKGVGRTGVEALVGDQRRRSRRMTRWRRMRCLRVSSLRRPENGLSPDCKTTLTGKPVSDNASR